MPTVVAVERQHEPSPLSYDLSNAWGKAKFVAK